jgi:hypothetical protein
MLRTISPKRLRENRIVGTLIALAASCGLAYGYFSGAVRAFESVDTDRKILAYKGPYQKEEMDPCCK